MQIGGSLHEMSKPIFWENKKYIINWLPSESAERVLKFNHAVYCALDIFQKDVSCLALYTEEVNLQKNFMSSYKTICRNYA